MTYTSVDIFDGPTSIRFHTHQVAVGDVLREAGVQLLPEDIVAPRLDQSIPTDGKIFIRRAKLVSVSVDGDEPQLIRTQSRTAGQVVKLLGLSIGPDDVVRVNGQFTDALPEAAAPGAPTDLAAAIEVQRASELVVQEDANPPLSIRTVARTVGEALMQAGYVVYLADRVQPALSTAVKPGTRVLIQRSKPVSIVVDGRRLRTRTHRATVGDVLAELNIVLYGDDYATPSPADPIAPDMEIRVSRLSNELVINQDVIPFDTQWAPDPELELDTQALGQEGQPGVRERRTFITYEDGRELKREQIADFVAREPQPRIYNYGTKVVVRTLDTPGGPVQYWRVLRMLATSYSASTAGVSSDNPYYGRTRCGTVMRDGIVAIDPRVIPLRTSVYVDGYGTGLACDTGSAIKGNRIDLGYEDSKLRLWYRWVNVYLLTPVPANIRYILD